MWVHAAKGFLYHQISLAQAQERQLTSHPATPSDIWMHAKDIWPEIADQPLMGLTNGRTYLNETGQIAGALYAPPGAWMRIEGYQPPKVEEIRQWFSVPADIEIDEEFF